MLKIFTITLISFIISGCATTSQIVENKKNGYATVKEFTITNDKEKIISKTILLINNNTTSEFKQEDSTLKKNIISQNVSKYISLLPSVHDDHISLNISFVFTEDNYTRENNKNEEVHKFKNSVLVKNRNPLNLFQYLRVSNEVNVDTETVYIEVTVDFPDEYLSKIRTKI